MTTSNFDDTGHLNEEALTAAADGELELLSGEAEQHLEACDLCHQRLGDAVLLAMNVHEAMQEAALMRAPVRIPAGAIIGALVVAALGALPFAVDLPETLAHSVATLLRGLPVLVTALFTAAHKLGGDSPLAVALVWCAAAVTLATAGIAVARGAPRELAFKGARG
jgi:hypothetical protein